MSEAAYEAMKRVYGSQWIEIFYLINKNLSLTILPIEILEIIAQKLLKVDLLTAIRFCQVSKNTYTNLLEVRTSVEARRVRWLPELNNRKFTISDDGCAITCRIRNDACEWASGSLLPTTGRVSFRVRIKDLSDKYWFGSIYIGVCTEANTDAWGFCPLTTLSIGRFHRYANGKRCDGSLHGPPANYPNGHETKLMFDEAGRPTRLLMSELQGAVIEVIVDHGEGSLSFRVNDGSVLGPLLGFPRGAQLRPWLQCNLFNSKIVCIL